MDLIVQWPATITTGPVPEGEKVAEEVVLGHLPRRAEMACIDWQIERDKVADFVPESARVVVTATNIWRHPDAHPLVLLMLVLNRYGQDALDWEVETLRQTIEKDGIQLSQSAWTKILAARLLLLSPSPWRQWNVFHLTARGLAGIAPNFHYLEEPDLGHLFLLADCMKITDPSRETSDEVDKYAAAALRQDGQPWAPPPLTFAQRELESPELECRNCGAIHRDDGDTRCVSCQSHALLPVPYPFAALRDQVSAGFEKRRRSGSLNGLREDDPGDRCIARLLAAWDFAKERRAALAAQRGLL